MLLGFLRFELFCLVVGFAEFSVVRLQFARLEVGAYCRVPLFECLKGPASEPKSFDSLRVHVQDLVCDADHGLILAGLKFAK